MPEDPSTPSYPGAYVVRRIVAVMLAQAAIDTWSSDDRTRRKAWGFLDSKAAAQLCTFLGYRHEDVMRHVIAAEKKPVYRTDLRKVS